MASMVPTLYWFDRWDERIGLLRVVGELVHTEELNGEDTLEFCSYELPAKGDRLLWLDGETWREHLVVRTEEPLEGLCSVYAESSLCEMLDDFHRGGAAGLAHGASGTDGGARADEVVDRVLHIPWNRRGTHIPPERTLGAPARRRGLGWRGYADHHGCEQARGIEGDSP